MATPLFDNIAIDFVGRIPTTFKTPFTGGGAMPDSYVLTSTQIKNFVNRALHKFFNDMWKTLREKIILTFPELSKYSAAITLTTGNYTIGSDGKHFDLYKILGAVGQTNNKYIRPVDDTKYTLYLSQEYSEFVPTVNNPAIIQVNNLLAVFPQSFAEQIKVHYVRLPNDPTTGLYLTQNGSYDSPFYPHWNRNIADIAYMMYLEEAGETS